MTEIDFSEQLIFLSSGDWMQTSKQENSQGIVYQGLKLREKIAMDSFRSGCTFGAVLGGRGEVVV